ncbi:MAG: glycosyltransferase family 2 protein [Ornithinimicrobium sp.]
MTVAVLTRSVPPATKGMVGEPSFASEFVVAVVPAHNEEAGLAETLRALAAQSRPPDLTVVISDNSTDGTVALAGAFAGVVVIETVDNADKKAGALNHVLSLLLPHLDDDDLILAQDADSVLSDDFIENAVGHLVARPEFGAIGGVFAGTEGGGFVGHLQRNEYARYARDVQRMNGKCLVVTGTAALFRANTLRDVSAARLRGTLPEGDGHGGVYDTTVLTEDNELSFALLHLGHKIASPADCTLLTEVMESWSDLWTQRLRWKRGAVENCLQYGLTKVTWRYWGRQILTALGLLVTVVYFGTIVWALTLGGGFVLHPFWVGVTGVFVLERVLTVRYRGWRQMVLSASMYELTIDMFLQFVHAKAYVDVALNRERKW